MSKEILYVGLDAGKNTGFAVWSPAKGEFLDILSLGFWEAIARLETLRYRHEAGEIFLVVYLEDTNHNKPTFSRYRGEAKVREKISQSVGKNKRDAQLLEDWVNLNKIKLIKIPPTRAKWKADTFRNYTGYKGSTNEHKRDAAMLVFNRK